jgi:hypothetical protein
MKKGLANLVVVLDRSGSMESIKGDAEGGFNEFIRKQKETPGECAVDLVQFDAYPDVQVHIDTVYAGLPLANVPPLKLEPRGWTPLNDAVAETIRRTGQRLSLLPEDQRPERILFVILTDGLENRSRQYPGAAGKAAVKQMIQHQQDVYKWAFIFLGANFDAVAEAREYGIPATAAASFDSARSPAAFGAAAAVADSYRRTGDAPEFSDEQRENMKPTTPAAPAKS